VAGLNIAWITAAARLAGPNQRLAEPPAERTAVSTAIFGPGRFHSGAADLGVVGHAGSCGCRIRRTPVVPGRRDTSIPYKPIGPDRRVACRIRSSRCRLQAVPRSEPLPLSPRCHFGQNTDAFPLARILPAGPTGPRYGHVGTRRSFSPKWQRVRHGNGSDWNGLKPAPT